MANPIPNLFRVPELKEKILFTLFILLIYRVGAHITVPGINVAALRAQFGALQGTFLGIYDMFVGGGLSRATIFALGIMPYISASIMFQLLAAVFPTVEKMQKEGEEGRKKLTQWTRYVTILLSLIQSYGYSVFLGSLPGAVALPGLTFTFTTVVSLTVGAVFVMWLGEQITEQGIGNGMSLLIFFGIIESFPAAVVRTWESLMVGEIGLMALVALLLVIVGTTAGVVAMTMAARKIPVQIPRKVVGRGRIQEGQKSFIPLRVNSAGVMPIIFAQAFIVVPGTLAAVEDLPATGLAAEARQAYERAVEAQRAGQWARYGEELRRLGETLERLAPVPTEVVEPVEDLRVVGRPIVVGRKRVKRRGIFATGQIDLTSKRPKTAQLALA